MCVGTRSVLFGVHQFLLHPLTVAAAWWRLFGFPWDPRLWIAFFLHDIGYWGKPEMDSPEGERHVELGAAIMGRLFGDKWRTFCLYHSRFYAQRDGASISKLCVADKYSFVITPRWLYLLLARASGELDEYMDIAARGERGRIPYSPNGNGHEALLWHQEVRKYLTAWVHQRRAMA